MSKILCTSDGCKRVSCALCHCCKQNLCLLHLQEHCNVIMSQLNPLVDEVNTIEERLHLIDIKDFTKNFHKKLQAWRQKCYKTIDDLCQKKTEEINRIIENKIGTEKQEISLLRRRLSNSFGEDHVTQEYLDSIKAKVSQIQVNIQQIEDLTFDIRMDSLSINDSMIQIAETQRNLQLLLTKPAKTRSCTDIQSSIISANDRYFIFHTNSHLWLINEDLEVVKRLPWNHEKILDICWSSTLDRFILTTENCGLCFVHENSISSNTNDCVTQEKFRSCTCSDTSLYLTTDNGQSTIMEYRLVPSIEIVKQWNSTEIDGQVRYIDKIRYNNEALAMVVQKHLEKVSAIELRSTSTFDKIWSIELDMNVKPYEYGLNLLDDSNWLFINRTSSTILYITKRGKIKERCHYSLKICDATVFKDNTLGILTDNRINLHEL